MGEPWGLSQSQALTTCTEAKTETPGARVCVYWGWGGLDPIPPEGDLRVTPGHYTTLLHMLCHTLHTPTICLTQPPIQP